MRAIQRSSAGYTQLVVQPLIHASIRLQVGDKEIHIDPVTKLGGRITDYAAMPKASAFCRHTWPMMLPKFSL